MSEENLSVSTESVVAPVETAAEPIPEAAPPPSPKLEDLLTPGELAAVHAARKQAVVDAGKAGAPKGKREVVGLLALHGCDALPAHRPQPLDRPRAPLRARPAGARWSGLQCLAGSRWLLRGARRALCAPHLARAA